MEREQHILNQKSQKKIYHETFAANLNSTHKNWRMQKYIEWSKKQL